jgi:coenzyme F420-reducing hydrogenase delta subunit
MNESQATPAVPAAGALPEGQVVTAFICANCARTGIAPTSGRRARPTKPDFQWPAAAREVLVPCTGRLQPEHLLKAFEAGADLVCIVACDEGNCHHLEGSRRAKARAEFVDRMLAEIGLGGGRILLCHLPGSAREDMALGAAGKTPAAQAASQQELAARLRQIRDEVALKLKQLAPNPLRSAASGDSADGPYEVEETDDSED